MGQYYLPALFETVKPISKETVITTVPPHYFGNGMKLTEHSYFGNSVVNTVINLVCMNGKVRVVWVGDYADDIKRKGEKYSLYHAIQDNNSINSYDTVNLSKPSRKKYMLNHTKMECVNLANYPHTYKVKTFSLDENGKIVSKKEIEDVLHPLPLLTCMGNYRGGGDYWPKFAPKDTLDYVGTWAGDVISFTDQEPNDKWEEIQPRFYHPTYDLISDLIAQAKYSIEDIKSVKKISNPK